MTPPDEMLPPAAEPDDDVPGCDCAGSLIETDQHEDHCASVAGTWRNEPPHRRWRTGISWGAAGGQMSTLVEQGTGDPDDAGRRPDDRLVGSLLADDAALVVDAVNAQLAYDAPYRALAKARAEVARLTRERDGRRDQVAEIARLYSDAQAEVERLRAELDSAGRARIEFAAASGRQLGHVQAERDRYRAALERIAGAYPAVGNSAGSSPGDVARKALAGES